MAKRNIYSPEFKRDAVRMASTTDLSMQQLADFLKISVSTLGRWKRDLEAQGSEDMGDERDKHDEAPVKPATGAGSTAEPGQSYQNAWDHRARDGKRAITAVDGSGSEEIVRLTGQYTSRQVRTALRLEPTDLVFELGCGVGRIGRELAPHCAKWFGADISANMLREAWRRMQHIPEVGFYHLQRTSLAGIATDFFDKAYSVAVFCHMDKEDMFLYLQEMARTLKPGGWFYFETWNLLHPVGWKRWEFELRHWAHADQGKRKDVARNQFSSPGEVRMMTLQAGFEIGVCYSDSPWVQMVAMKPGPDQQVEATQEYFSKHARKIAFDEEWTECFSRLVDVTYGNTGAQEFLDWLNGQVPSEATDLYRHYLAELWLNNEQRWGTLPGEAERFGHR